MRSRWPSPEGPCREGPCREWPCREGLRSAAARLCGRSREIALPERRRLTTLARPALQRPCVLDWMVSTPAVAWGRGFGGRPEGAVERSRCHSRVCTAVGPLHTSAGTQPLEDSLVPHHPSTLGQPDRRPRRCRRRGACRCGVTGRSTRTHGRSLIESTFPVPRGASVVQLSCVRCVHTHRRVVATPYINLMCVCACGSRAPRRASVHL